MERAVCAGAASPRGRIAAADGILSPTTGAAMRFITLGTRRTRHAPAAAIRRTRAAPSPAAPSAGDEGASISS